MERRFLDKSLANASDEFYDCPFCDLMSSSKERLIQENRLALAVRDLFPVTEGHTLIIPKRHVLDYFDLTEAEVSSIHRLIINQRSELDRIDNSIQGYNIGANCGLVAGQSVWHCHIHLIPRREGDSEYPKGGVRHVIPLKSKQ